MEFIPVFLISVLLFIIIWTILDSIDERARQRTQITLDGLQDLNKRILESIEEEAREKEVGEDEESHTIGEHLDELDERIHRLSHKVEELGEQNDHTGKVLLLLLDHLNLEHQIQPQTEVLVKKSKERSA